MLSPQKLLIVVGGGAAADEIRRLDAQYHLSPGHTHWAAIAAMTLNAGVVSRLCGHLPIISDRMHGEKAWLHTDAVLLDTTAFLTAEQINPGRALPEDWSVTSDSIAAFVALNWPARQLLFCKSCDLAGPLFGNLQTMRATPNPDARRRYSEPFDEWFPNLLQPLHDAGVTLSWLNLSALVQRPQPFFPAG